MLEELKRFINTLTEEDIKGCYFHPNSYDGSPELNIEFNNIDWYKIEKLQGKIKDIDKCAHWE